METLSKLFAKRRAAREKGGSDSTSDAQKSHKLKPARFDELSLIMRNHDNNEWAPRNQSAQILAVKGKGEAPVTVGDVVRAAREKAGNTAPASYVSPKPTMEQARERTGVNTGGASGVSLIGYLHASSSAKLAAIAETRAS